MHETSKKIRRYSPDAGEHTNEIMRKVGFNDAQVNDWRAKGAIAWPERSVSRSLTCCGEWPTEPRPVLWRLLLQLEVHLLQQRSILGV
jgi:hypothetical protein